MKWVPYSVKVIYSSLLTSLTGCKSLRPTGTLQQAWFSNGQLSDSGTRLMSDYEVTLVNDNSNVDNFLV